MVQNRDPSTSIGLTVPTKNMQLNERIAPGPRLIRTNFNPITGYLKNQFRHREKLLKSQS